MRRTTSRRGNGYRSGLHRQVDELVETVDDTTLVARSDYDSVERARSSP